MRKPELIWDAMLDELQLQMSQATFDSWLRGSMLISCQDGAVTIGAKTTSARDWLDNRLRAVVERTVARVAGQPLAVRFVVLEQAALAASAPEPSGDIEAPARAFVVPEYDVHNAGWFKVAEYECRFWAPVLRRVAWRVLEIVRKDDRRKRKTEWTPLRRYTAPALAEQVPCGRQALVGVNRQCEQEDGQWVDTDGIWWRHQNGAFDRLQMLGAAQVEQRGQGGHITYRISVRTALAILTPRQMRELPSRLQVEHDDWLADQGFNPGEWDL